MTEQIGFIKPNSQENPVQNKEYKNKKDYLPQNAAQQGTTIPLGWKPTPKEPVPVVRCTYIFPESHAKAFTQCNRWSLRGTTVCQKHGGSLPGVQQHAAAVVEAGFLRLIGNVDDFVDGLIDLANNSESDAVRLAAIRDGLDRAGVKQGLDINLNVETTDNAFETLYSKLKAIGSRNPADPDPTDEIQDGEVISDTDE